MIEPRRTRWARHVEHMEEKNIVNTILVGRTKGNIRLGRRTRNWVDNIKMDLREIQWGGVDSV
jgi:hypothetical protein